VAGRVSVPLTRGATVDMKARKPPPEFTDYDLRLLRVFDAVVRGGGFTGAEVILNKSKSAISIDISSLETRLGANLCRRGRGGFALTTHGKEIHLLAQELFKQLRDFRKRADLVATVVSGELAVALEASIPGDHAHDLAQVLHRFHSDNSQVSLKVDSASAERVIQWVLDGSATIGIGVLPRDYPELEACLLYEEVIDLYCGVGHPLFDVPDGELNIERLAAYDFSDLPSRQHAVDKALLERLTVKVQANTAQAQLLLLSNGRFIGFLPRSCALAAGTQRLRSLAPLTLSYKCAVVAFVLRDVPRSLACEHFEETLRSVFSGARLQTDAAANEGFRDPPTLQHSRILHSQA
jgi:LysR family transcriptional regulator, transcriptional activator for bauABCD operon